MRCRSWWTSPCISSHSTT